MKSFRAIGGLFLLLGCSSVSERLPDAPIRHYNSVPDSTAEQGLEAEIEAMLHYHKGVIALESAQEETAVYEFTKAINVDDNVLYRVKRYSANFNLALTLPAESRERQFDMCVVDAMAIKKYLPNGPDGFIALGLAYAVRNTDNESVKKAGYFLNKAMQIINDGKKPRFFEEEIIEKLQASISNSLKEYY